MFTVNNAGEQMKYFSLKFLLLVCIMLIPCQKLWSMGSSNKIGQNKTKKTFKSLSVLIEPAKIDSKKVSEEVRQIWLDVKAHKSLVRYDQKLIDCNLLSLNSFFESKKAKKALNQELAQWDEKRKKVQEVLKRIELESGKEKEREKLQRKLALLNEHKHAKEIEKINKHNQECNEEFKLVDIWNAQLEYAKQHKDVKKYDNDFVIPYPLHLVIREHKNKETTLDDLKIIAILLLKAVNPNLKDHVNMTPLMLLGRCEDEHFAIQVAELLYAWGVDLNYKMGHPRSPMREAVLFNRKGLVKTFLKLGMELPKDSGLYDHPLLQAAKLWKLRGSDIAVIKRLKEKSDGKTTAIVVEWLKKNVKR